MGKHTVQIKKWGNSHAIRIPTHVLNDLDLKENDTLEISVDKENQLIILNIDDGLTPYQRLLKNSSPSERTSFQWDDNPADRGVY